MNENDFKPAEGVNITNAYSYIAAIEEAVRRDVMLVDKKERSMLVGMVAGALRLAADQLGEFRANLEATGQADRPSEEQFLRLKMIFRRAREKRNSEN